MTEEEKSHLAPHPWDTYGKPPRPGGFYDPPEATAFECEWDHPGCKSPDECADTLEMDAEDIDGRAENARSEAEDLEEIGRASCRERVWR